MLSGYQEQVTTKSTITVMKIISPKWLIFANTVTNQWSYTILTILV